jgi:bifunctional non-homologous end joining protein LigD
LTFLPARSAVVDGEVVACDESGRPDFEALLFNRAERIMVWCFDLLELDGNDLRQLPLIERRARLEKLIRTTPYLKFSDHFENPSKLLAACEEHKLEGIISKKANAPYRSGARCGWIKVKCRSWREANKNRGELFETAK